jgi:hypothetical protein
MDSDLKFQFFVIYVFPPMILCFGMIGNMVGLVVVSQKKMKKIGPRLTYLFLFLMDTIFLPLIIINHLGYAYGLDLLVVNSISCKINTYINFFLGAVSPWLLVYISVEKFISIQYPGKSFSFRSLKNQLIYFIVLIVSCCSYYTPIIFSYDITTTYENNTIVSKFCYFNSIQDLIIGTWMDLALRCLTPFILMLIFSILLISAIFRARGRVLSAFTSAQNNRFEREIRHAITSIIMNITFILFEMPLSVSLLQSFVSANWSYINQFTFYLFYCSYSINFYVMFISNSLFRNEFLNLFILKKRN